MERLSKETIDEMLAWLKEQQIKDVKEDFHYGGFSPYPDVIKAAGVISTAKALEAIMLYSNPEEWPKDKTITDGIEFLLRVQLDSKLCKKVDPIDDGGFPPMGDLELITYKPTPDATAEAVRVLELYRKPLNEKNLLDKYKEREIRTAINRGLHWLVCYYFNLKPWFDSIETERVSLDLAIDSCLSFVPFYYYFYGKIIDENTIRNRRKRMIERYTGALKEKGYLPFKWSEPLNPSLTNTAEGVRLLTEYCTSIENDEVLIEIKRKANEFIKNNLDDLFRIDTEYDHIDAWCYRPSSGIYPECHSKIPPILYLAGENEEVMKKIQKKITVPIHVDRGRKEASVKSTAMFLIYNKLVK